MATFVAIDFETADQGRDSACAIGLARVSGRRITAQQKHLIRPPRREFLFSYLHGIRWSDVAKAPTFGQLWPKLAPILDGAEFLVAHNASFDRGVLSACCDAAGLAMPALPFECTVRMARHAWGLHPTKLPDVCKHLGIALDHHDPLSDAVACARIAMAALAAR